MSKKSSSQSSGKVSESIFNGIIKLSLHCYHTCRYSFKTDLFKKRENFWMYLALVFLAYVNIIKGNYGYFVEFLHMGCFREIIVKIVSWFSYFQLLFITATFMAVAFMVIAGIPGYRMHRRYQKAINGLNLKDGLGKRPKLLKVEEIDENRTKLELLSEGVGEERYKARMDDLRAAAGQRVESINFKKDDSRKMEIYLAKRLLPEKVLYSDLISHATTPYSFVVGKSMAGVVTASLETTPHFMVAGATDGGKSVTFKSYLTGLLESSERIQFYLMDFKGTELNDFKGLPNVVVVNEILEGQIWLDKLVKEMESRYKSLADKGHNKIDPERDNLDRIVIAIDECSDIRKARRGEPSYTVYEKMRIAIDDLARKARASGIHLMVATQKIDKATLDTRVQENIQGRLALRMDTPENSRRVLQNEMACGLPAVPGRGIWKKGADYVEVQTPYQSEEEIKDRIKKLIDSKKFAHVKMIARGEVSPDSSNKNKHIKKVEENVQVSN